MANQPSPFRNCHKFYIDGNWVEPSGTRVYNAINPATEEVSGQIIMGEVADVDRAVQAARKAFVAYSQTTPQQRVELLQSIMGQMVARKEDLRAAIVDEMGQPYWVTDIQLQLALGHLMTAIGILPYYEFEKRIGDGITLLRRVPIGVVAAIGAWNFPIPILMTKIVPALATGCTVVAKPSKFSSFSGVILAEIMDKAGVPAGVFNLILGEGSTVGDALTAHPGVDMVSVTGSVAAGVQIARNAAGTVKRVHQELGGKSANVVLPGANLPACVGKGIASLMINSGQGCSSPSRLLVPNAQLPEAKAVAKATIDNVCTVGEPYSGAYNGPVANKDQFETVQRYIAIGIEEGATVVAGGLGKPAGLEKGFYCQPTVFADTTPHMRIVQEEIFGPVMVMQGYDNIEHALELANGTEFGLAGYVSGGNLAETREFARHMRAGQIYMMDENASDVFDLMAPFGGFKKSGNGREWGAASFEEFTEPHAILGYFPATPGATPVLDISKK